MAKPLTVLERAATMRREMLVEAFREGFMAGADPRRKLKRTATQDPQFAQAIGAAFRKGVSAGNVCLSQTLLDFRLELSQAEADAKLPPRQAVICHGHDRRTIHAPAEPQFAIGERWLHLDGSPCSDVAAPDGAYVLADGMPSADGRKKGAR